MGFLNVAQFFRRLFARAPAMRKHQAPDTLHGSDTLHGIDANTAALAAVRIVPLALPVVSGKVTHPGT